MFKHPESQAGRPSCSGLPGLCDLHTLLLRIPGLSRRETPLEAPSTHAFPETSTQASLSSSRVWGTHIVCDRGSSGVSENKTIAFCHPSGVFDLALKFPK